MIRGIGTDLVEVDRVERAAGRRGPAFLERLFTPAEIEYCERRHHRFESYAARFAAKEAFLKALGTGLRQGITWQEMEVLRDGDGRPEVLLKGRALAAVRERGVDRVFLSLSHTRRHGMAMVVLEG